MRSKTTENEVERHIIMRYYDVEKRIGKGSYGVVYRAFKKSNNQPVALKKIYDAFKSSEDAQRTYREVVYLKAFRGHPNIIQILDVHKSSNNRDLYLVFEYMEIDLQKYLLQGNKMKENQIRHIMYQLLKALKYIHSGNVMHRDVKPSNILLNSDCVCKLADFGLARSSNECSRLEPGAGKLTEYVATRWYRAPEILMGARRYHEVVDIWSLGCVLAEMVTGRPLFPGSSSLNQLEHIGYTLKASREDMEYAMAYLGCQVRLILPPWPKWPLTERLSPASFECIDLADRMLQLDPFMRLTASDALRHPYIFRYRGREPVLNRPVLPKYSDSKQLTIHDYRTALYNYDRSRQQYSHNKPSTLPKRHINTSKPSTDPELNPRRIYPIDSRQSTAKLPGEIIRCRGYNQLKFK